MSVRLFHRHARLVIPRAGGTHTFTWLAFHRRPVPWSGIFAPALALVGFAAQRESNGLRFGEGGSLRWTNRSLWTTIQLQLPPCPEKKAVLLAAGLLKAARYGEPRTSHEERRN